MLFVVLVTSGGKVIVGLGQGAVIAAGMAHPLVADLALASKNVSAVDSLKIARAWSGIRLVALAVPWILKGIAEIDELVAAVPELFEEVPEGTPSLPTVALQYNHAMRRFGDDFRR